MAGDGNCLPNSILLQLGFDEDPDEKDLYNHIYMRRQPVRHLMENWKKLGEQIIHDVTMQYGRPDSEINGRLICKEFKKGGEIEDLWIQCIGVV